ncbi:MAG: hypothetical protein JW699_08720 [Chitinispirillaceae bacterium]|nr:hypothetical protein [Chitinispirillaceae bacterium]
MIRNELIKQSPLRILQQSMHGGGLGKGNIAVIAAPKGLGKTACLVHLATDHLLEGKHVIHVSFADDTRHIITWYEDIFDEIAGRYRLDGAKDVHDDIIKQRVILNFRQDGVSASQVQRSVRSLIKDGNFNAEAVFVDGYDFTRATGEEFGSFKRFAEEAGLELWFSASVKKGLAASQQVPDYLDRHRRYIAVFIVLEPSGNYINLKLVKDHDKVPVNDLHLKLDPHNLLIAEEADS